MLQNVQENPKSVQHIIRTTVREMIRLINCTIALKFLLSYKKLFTSERKKEFVNFAIYFDFTLINHTNTKIFIDN